MTTVREHVLVRILAERGLSQRQLAGLLKLSPVRVNQLVREVKFPSPMTVAKIARFLGVTVDQLVDQEGRWQE